MANYNHTAFALIQKREQCALDAYLDGGGVPTIGWGETGPGIKLGMKWTQAEADASFWRRFGKVQDDTRALVKTPLNEQQEAALISLVYNVGAGALARSMCLGYVNIRNWIRATRELIDFDRDGGVEVRGLLLRRLEEATLFLENSRAK